MLIWRVLTALCLIPLVLWAVIGLQSKHFGVLAAIFFSLGAWEWANLCHFKTKVTKGIYAICFLLIFGLLCWVDSISVLLLGSLFWLMPCYWVLSYEGGAPFLLKNNGSKAIIGLLTLTIACYGLYAVHRLPFGPGWIILLFLLVWSSDTFAYFIGRKWGRLPLAPLVSPKKTLAGFWGGLIGALGVAGVAFMLIQSPRFNAIKPLLLAGELPAWLSISFITILLAIFGDLFESLIKRISGVKDSGNILPGHGGILDRTDSLIAALPFYALCLVWLSRA
ncbi:MAG: phosphatidate cytidylyltransferase [Gammaproteobacteria bacterium]|nr:phosphatidate cytidylyltransferase [Gammaproteobacteria bacterium]